jgi:hypothetical protein
MRIVAMSRQLSELLFISADGRRADPSSWHSEHGSTGAHRLLIIDPMRWN